jgi:hypothetical protein
MSTEQLGNESAPYVHLFQKAHQKIVLLERLDEQLTQLLGKRHEMQEDLRQVQQAINDELEHRITAYGEAPGRALGAIAAIAQGNAGGQGARHNAATRFAGQAVSSVAVED